MVPNQGHCHPLVQGVNKMKPLCSTELQHLTFSDNDIKTSRNHLVQVVERCFISMNQEGELCLSLRVRYPL
jgi:hypothetical protein